MISTQLDWVHQNVKLLQSELRHTLNLSLSPCGQFRQHILLYNSSRLFFCFYFYELWLSGLGLSGNVAEAVGLTSRREQKVGTSRRRYDSRHPERLAAAAGCPSAASVTGSKASCFVSISFIKSVSFNKFKFLSLIWAKSGYYSRGGAGGQGVI